MSALSSQQKIHYILRIAVAMCFIGHGTFGIITKPVWANYFAVFGIEHDLAFTLMPVVGAVDILLGLIMLIYPIRIVPAWLIFWGIMTALLRPLSGEPFAEFIERAGNFGAPLALLLLSGSIHQNIKHIFKPLDAKTTLDAEALQRVAGCLKVIVFLLFLGHGWLNIIEKKGIIQQYSNLGFSDPVRLSLIIGWFEVIAAFMVLFRPVRSILIILFFWKMISETLYPHYGILEWVERGGSYACILALYVTTGAISHTTSRRINKTGIV